MKTFLILTQFICVNVYAMDRLPYEYDWQTFGEQPYKNRVVFSSHPSPEKEEKIPLCQMLEKITPVEKEKVKKRGGPTAIAESIYFPQQSRFHLEGWTIIGDFLKQEGVYRAKYDRLLSCKDPHQLFQFFNLVSPKNLQQEIYLQVAFGTSSKKSSAQSPSFLFSKEFKEKFQLERTFQEELFTASSLPSIEKLLTELKDKKLITEAIYNVVFNAARTENVKREIEKHIG